MVSQELKYATAAAAGAAGLYLISEVVFGGLFPSIGTRIRKWKSEIYRNREDHVREMGRLDEKYSGVIDRTLDDMRNIDLEGPNATTAVQAGERALRLYTELLRGLRDDLREERRDAKKAQRDEKFRL